MDIFYQFHLSAETTSFTLRFSSSIEKGTCTKLLIGPTLHQLSCQKLNSLSLPITQLTPFRKISSPSLILDHTLEQGSFVGFVAFNLCLMQYLLFNTLLHNASFSILKHQLSLAGIEKFLPLAVSRPSPPSLLGRVIFCHPTQCIFLTDFKEPHKKFLLTLSMLSRSLPRKALHCMT